MTSNVFLEIATMPTSTGQHNRFFLLLLACILLLPGSVANLQAQDEPSQASIPNEPVQTTENLTPQQSSMLMELEKLKAQSGGGVAERLEGVVPGSNPQQQSFESMKNLIRSQPPTTDSGTPLSELALPPGFSIPGDQDAEVMPLPSGPNGARSVPAGSTNAEPAQKLLRSSARMLEQVAADLEQARLYDQADELRKTAAQYWLQARSMD